MIVTLLSAVAFAAVYLVMFNPKPVAVGRTSAVTGSARVTTNPDGSVTVESMKVNADLSQLASDSGRRDNFLRHNSLETSSYPQATFASEASFSVPAAVVGGTAGAASAEGKLTIHGVTRDVSIPLKIQRRGSTVNVVGSYQFHWGDFGVQQPTVPVASVQSDPTIEISLVLTSAARTSMKGGIGIGLEVMSIKTGFWMEGDPSARGLRT